MASSARPTRPPFAPRHNVFHDVSSGVDAYGFLRARSRQRRRQLNHLSLTPAAVAVPIVATHKTFTVIWHMVEQYLQPSSPRKDLETTSRVAVQPAVIYRHTLLPFRVSYSPVRRARGFEGVAVKLCARATEAPRF